MNPHTVNIQAAQPGAPSPAAIHGAGAQEILVQDTGCEQLLERCARMARTAHAQLGRDCPPEMQELAATLAECSLLCATVLEAMALQARTERDLRLICAAVCHLTADLCAGRRAEWAASLAATASACAEACRQLPIDRWRRSAAAA